jgi:hypothetical protein
MLGTAVLVLMLGQLPGPASEMQAAANDLATMPELERPHFRYLTTFNLAETSQPDAVKTARFWLNSLSQRKRMSAPVAVTQTLHRIDIREYGWQSTAWETLTATDPYFRFGYLTPERYAKTYQAERYLRFYTQSSGAVMRMDYFVAKTSKEPHYSAFLGLPKDLAALKKQYFLQEKEAKSIYLHTGGSVVRSGVTLNNRKLTRIPSMLGYWYQSQDVKSNDPTKNQNVLHNLFDIQQDAGEFIWSLPNGLQGYYIADAEGAQVPFADPEIASDTATSYRNKLVVAPRSCVGCHSTGLNDVKDVISGMLEQDMDKPNQRVISTFNKQHQMELEEFYLGGLSSQMTRDRMIYTDAVKRATGLEPTEAAKLHQQMAHAYDEILVNRAAAATELGMTSQELQIKGQNVLNNVLAASLGGEGIPRDAWESIYPSVMKSFHVLQGGER